MSDLKAKLTEFFHSDFEKFKEFEQALVESKNALDWANAVNLFRTGMKKLKEKDLSGCEEIKKANEMLKAVVATNKKEDVVKAEVQGLNESVEKIDVNKASESVDSLGASLGLLYEAMKNAGMPAMLNESELYDETCPMCGEDVQPEETTVVNVKEIAPVPAGAAPVATTNPPAPTMPAGAAPVATTPTSSAPAGAAPAPTEQVKESAYEHGFLEARKRYMKGGNAKASAKDIAEKELSEKPYAYVNRYMEGFVAGHAFHEEVMRDTDPKMFEESK